MICLDSRAQSLYIVVEMRFWLAGDICGAPLVIYCISSLCTERFDCQNHAIPYALIRRITVATIEIGHCRTFIYIPMMNSVSRLSLIFSLTTTTNHFPFPHICNKMSIMYGTIIHAINATSIKPASQSLAHMIWESALHIYLFISVSNQVYYTAYCTPSSACILSQIIYTNRSNLIVVSNRTA